MYLPSAGCHEAIRRLFSVASQPPHLGARDELEVIVALRVIEVHGPQLVVVGCHLEWHNLQLAQAWSHLKNLK